MLAAILTICGTSMLTSCSNDDNNSGANAHGVRNVVS